RELFANGQCSWDKPASSDRDIVWESAGAQTNQISQFSRQVFRIGRPHSLLNQFQVCVFPKTIGCYNKRALVGISPELVGRCGAAAKERFPRRSTSEFLFAVRGE